MENVSPKHSSREKKRHESEKNSKKEKQAKSNVPGTKSRKKNSKSLPPKQAQSTTSSDVNQLSETEPKESGSPSDHRSVSHVSRDRDVVKGVEGAASGDSPEKRERSKSRSRSGSRSRFSGFFRRKRYSMSETDLNKSSRNENDKRCDSAENITTRNRPNTLPLNSRLEEDGSALHLRSNLKTTPPHRSYDSRVQPRDRLLHMTVADAVKEQRLRRGNSAHRSPRSHDTAVTPSGPMYMSSPSLAAAVVSFDVPGQADPDATASSILPPLKRKQKSDEVLRPSFKHIPQFPFVQGRHDRGDATPIEVPNEASRVDHSSLGQNILCQDVPHSRELINAAVDSGKRKPADKSTINNQESVHKRPDLAETQTVLNARPPHQADSLQNYRGHSPSPSQYSSIEEAKEAKLKRKASLSKFLELRQTLPSSISRSHRLSQSSDSGVTSRDTSPSAPVVSSDVTKRQPEKTLPSQELQLPEKAANPYVISSVSISPILITAPRVSINGSQHEAKNDPAPVTKNRPTFIKLDDSMGESSSISSSPQINSMTSSFRSSDQGYINSDSDEDDASFSTPPEEVDSASSGKRERASRTFNPGILEKLLETSRAQSRRGLFPELDLDNWDTKRSQPFSKVDENVEENHLPTDIFMKKEKTAEAEPKYIPRGVRRSKSDVDSRHKPSDSISRQTSCANDQRPRTSSADAFQLSPSFGREKVKFDLDILSAASTSTLVVQDDTPPINGDHANLERSDQKLVPVMGTVAQQKYRRTYSPSRVKKLNHLPKDEKPKASDAFDLPKKVYPEGRAQPSSQTSIQSNPAQELLEKPQLLSTTKLEPSPIFPKKGILKSPVRDRNISFTDTSSGATSKSEMSVELPTSEIGVKSPQKSDKSIEMPSKRETSVKTQRKTDSSIETSSKTEISITTPQKSEISTTTPQKSEISITPPQKSENIIETSSKTEDSLKAPGKDSIPSIPISINIYDTDTSVSSLSPVSKATVSHATVSDEESDVPKTNSADISMNFPLIHGLEIGMHKVHSFSGYSLADYLKEQSKGNKKLESPGRVTKSKEAKSSRFSFKKKNGTNTESRKQSTEPKLYKKEIHSQESKPSPASDSTLQEADNSKFKIMVDKECQTSAWLVNSLINKKNSKTKKKLSSFSKKKKHQRRGSTVSDTFIPTDLKKHKESHQRSSLGDIRSACAAMASFTKDGDREMVLPVRVTRGASERSISKQARSKRHGEIITRHDPILPGSSLRSAALGFADESSQLPKPKKLSLAAVILLKNRLAKYREKKRAERNSIDETPDDDTSVHSVASDTLITIENELNLSKLEVSKETDIIDDDFYEPEFSLGYTRKQLRFESLPSGEAMQSEEPLPPLPLLTSRRMRQRRESTLRERRRKCVQYCKKFIAFLFSHIGLCSLVVAYTILGGFIFQALEDQAEYTVRSTIRERREKVVEQLVSLFFEFPRNEEGRNNFTRESNSTLLDYQVFIHENTKNRGWDGVEGVDEEGLWTFASSLLYAITVTTTIGNCKIPFWQRIPCRGTCGPRWTCYGHVAPKTPEGRIVTIGYAVVGIPLTLLCLTNIGDVMATGFRLLYGKICCGVCCTLFKPRRRRIQVDLEKGLGGPIITADEEQPDKPKEVIHVPTSLCLLLIAGYIFAGAMLFSMWENWDILTGSYFCFITLSTIGFGDIVPGMDSNAWAAEEKLVLCALYLVLGLSLIAMCFNLVQEDVKAKCRWLGMKLGIVDKHETPL